MGSKTPPNPAQIAIVTVHGTGDTATGPDGDKWFQNGSVFTDRLKQRLATQGVEAAIVPHLWSGANSAKHREDGARTLSRTIRELARNYGGVHIVGHSHGGNVADEAAAMVAWRLHKNRPQKISSVTTVGTPFFKNQVGAAEVFGGIAFLTVIALSVLALLIATPIVFLLVPQYVKECAQYNADIATLAAAGANAHAGEIAALQAKVTETEGFISFFQPMTLVVMVSALSLLLVVPLAVQGARRVLRIMRKQNENAKFFSIWHPNDEAISFLQRIEELPIEAFPRGALWRSSRTSGIVWGVRAVIVTFLLAIAVSVAGMIGVEITDDNYQTLGNTFGFNGMDLFGGMSTPEFGIFLFAATLLGAPLFFGAVYLLTRLVRGLAFEIVGRGWLNTSVAGILRGMAFGRDGDERIGQVATQSHTYGVRPFVLDGEIAERMRAGAANSATALIEKYRWSLFTVGPDTNGSVSKLATDAMTWNSLIHTTYFDQPEIANVIGDYIAENIERDREALQAKR